MPSLRRICLHDASDQSVLFGKWPKILREHQTKLRVLPARQYFETSQSAGSKIDQGLKVWHRLFVLESATYVSNINGHAKTLCRNEDGVHRFRLAIRKLCVQLWGRREPDLLRANRIEH